MWFLNTYNIVFPKFWSISLTFKDLLTILEINRLPHFDNLRLKKKSGTFWIFMAPEADNFRRVLVPETAPFWRFKVPDMKPFLDPKIIEWWYFLFHKLTNIGDSWSLWDSFAYFLLGNIAFKKNLLYLGYIGVDLSSLKKN